MRLASLPFLLAALAFVPACAQGGSGDDDGGTSPLDGRVPTTDAGLRDAGRRDAGRVILLPDAGSPSDAGPAVDAGPAPDGGGSTDSGRPDGGGGPTTCTPSPTNVLITEIMIASQSGSGDNGEWFEIHNLSACPVSLAGLVVESPTPTGTPVTHSVTAGVLTAGGFFVFAQSGDTAENHGLPYDYVYGSGSSGVVLNNDANELILSYTGTEIDRVAWGSTDHRVGAARQLSRGFSGDNLAIGSTSWCDATATYSSATGGPFLGTPGALNATCP